MRRNYEPIPPDEVPAALEASYQRVLQPLSTTAQPSQPRSSASAAYDRRRRIVQTLSAMIGTVALVLLVVTLVSHPATTQQASATSAVDPVPFTPPASSDPRIGWGIVGAGRISHEFAVALKVLGANITAVAAGSLPHAQSRAEAFAATFGIPNAYGSYEQLAKDPAVQVVYIGTTNQLHYDNTMLMLSHGKHVVCEKPLAMDEHEAKEMIEYARKKKRLLLTNYWTRWFPAIKFAQEVVESGELGEIIHLHGDFSFQAVPGIKSTERFFSRELGGGAMHDMGSYLVQFSLMFLFDKAKHVDIQASAVMIDDENVDLETAFVLSHRDKTAQFATSLRRPSDYDIAVFGTHGMLRIHTPANCPTNASYSIFQDADKQSQTPIPCCGQPVITAKEFFAPLPPYPQEYGDPQYPRGTGFVYVIEAVERCLDDGCTEMPAFSLDEQLEVAKLSDRILRHIGYLDDDEQEEQEEHEEQDVDKAASEA